MTLGELIRKLDYHDIYMQLRDSDNMEIIRCVKADSHALIQYYYREIVGWGTFFEGKINYPSFYVRLKGIDNNDSDDGDSLQ